MNPSDRLRRHKKRRKACMLELAEEERFFPRNEISEDLSIQLEEFSYILQARRKIENKPNPEQPEGHPEP